MRRGPPHKVFIGQRFGRLKVKEFAGIDKFKCRMYRCDCDCGGERTTSSQRLRNGKARSCGCMQKEVAAKNSRARILPNQGSCVGVIYAKYRQQSLSRGVRFDVSREELGELIRLNCHYCGAEPDNNSRKRFRYNGLDKVKPELGYTSGNLVPACWPCNRAKGSMDAESFLVWLKKTYEYQFGRFVERAP